MSEHIRIASGTEIPPGSGRLVEANGRRIAVFNDGGRFHAIDDACSHQGGPLSEGTLDGTVVTCPWHGARFDVTTGAVLGPPARRAVATRRSPLDHAPWRAAGGSSSSPRRGLRRKT
jgi:nitrite reductase/ring-hydroxylating ferredoxin subunit